MIIRTHKSGIRTLYTSEENAKDEKLLLNFIFATPIDSLKSANLSTTTMDLLHNFSPSHLIEHTIIEQNKELFGKLHKDYKTTIINAFTYVNFTLYEIEVKDVQKLKQVIPMLLTILTKQNEIAKTPLMHELEIINHEFKSDYLEINENSTIFGKSDIQNNKKTTKQLSNRHLSLIEKLNSQLAENENVTKYYKKYYVPENAIISVSGASKKVASEINILVDDFFKFSPIKMPKVHDFTSTINPEIYDNFKNRNNDFYNKLFEKRYYIFPLKNKNSNYSETRVFFQLPNNFKFELALNLLLSTVNRRIGIATPLTKELRANKKLIYGMYYNIETMSGSTNPVLSFILKTDSKKVKELLTAFRKTLNNIANKKIDIEDFKEEKKKFINAYYEYDSMQMQSKNTVDLISLLYSGADIKSSEKALRVIKQLEYEDLVNAAKFLSKTLAFSIQSFGNGITFEDLKVFEEDINNPLSKKDVKGIFGNDKTLNINENTYDATKDDDDDVPVIVFN